AVLAQDFILSQPQPINGPHQHASLAREVAVDLLFERGFEEVAGADCDAARQTTVECSAGRILVYGIAAVDAFPFQEEPANGGARSLGRDHDYVDVFWRHDAGLVLIDNAEPMGEIQGFAGGE